MAEIKKHGTVMKFNGPAKPQPKPAPAPKEYAHKVLMTHSDGKNIHRAGTIRKLTKPNQIEELIKRGLISPETYQPNSFDEPIEEDKTQAALNEARKSVWTPEKGKRGKKSE